MKLVPARLDRHKNVFLTDINEPMTIEMSVKKILVSRISLCRKMIKNQEVLSLISMFCEFKRRRRR